MCSECFALGQSCEERSEEFWLSNFLTKVGYLMNKHDLLSVQNLHVNTFSFHARPKNLVRGVSFGVKKGSVAAIVGESGSGKSLTAAAIMGLLPKDELHISPDSQIYFDNMELVHATPVQWQQVRGKRLAMIFQEPESCLNPVLRVGEQIALPLRTHLRLPHAQALKRAEELLHEVGITDPHRCIRSFPHELSGGQQQRMLIAMAIACEPELLIADEPTSSLDVTVQRQILDLLERLQRNRAMTMLLITHDLGIVAGIADTVIVYHQGVVREQGKKADVLQSPKHPYTQQLIASGLYVHQMENRQPGQEPSSASPREKLIEVNGLNKSYPIREGLFKKREFHAVKNVSFSLYREETLGVVGESGSGKTTLAMSILRLVQASGEVRLDGRNILPLANRELHPLRRRMQIVFQNPFASLNPRWPIRKILMSPMQIHKLNGNREEQEDEAGRLLELVGLSRTALSRFPHQFSGGERQRIAIARALSVRPDILICDEAVSALDMSIQVQIMDLLRSLQQQLGMAYLFISHDLAAIRYMADRLLVMYRGEVVEESSISAIYEAPEHPYTASLLAAEPRI